MFALETADGLAAAVKLRPDESGRASACLAAQRTAAAAGFPCPRLSTAAHFFADQVIHAEEWWPGGTVERDDDVAAGARSGGLLGRLMRVLARAALAPPLPNPPWVRWATGAEQLWPRSPHFDRRDPTPVPAEVDRIARRLLPVLTAVDLPRVVGHGDWEAQDLRWTTDGGAHVVHDWDSVAWLPEAAIAGAAAGCSASADVPTLAPLDSSAAFLDAFQAARGRAFSEPELHVAWAAGLWPALFNARAQALFEHSTVAWTAVREQADSRLLLAGL